MKNELYHHGIDGQKWGVTHGPPYPLSRAQHRAVVRSQKATEKRNISYRKSKKYAKRMSDEDLNATIDRLRREETYRQLVSKDDIAKSEAKAAKKQAKAIKKANQGSGNQNNQQSVVKKAEGTIKKSIKESIGNSIKTVAAKSANELADALFPKAPKVRMTRMTDGKYTVGFEGTKEQAYDIYNWFNSQDPMAAAIKSNWPNSTKEYSKWIKNNTTSYNTPNYSLAKGTKEIIGEHKNLPAIIPTAILDTPVSEVKKYVNN